MKNTDIPTLHSQYHVCSFLVHIKNKDIGRNGIDMICMEYSSNMPEILIVNDILAMAVFTVGKILSPSKTWNQINCRIEKTWEIHIVYPILSFVSSWCWEQALVPTITWNRKHFV